MQSIEPPDGLSRAECGPSVESGPLQPVFVSKAEEHHGRRVMFMHNLTACPVCAMTRELGLIASPTRLHVVVDGDLLVVTAADDLHRPGKSLCARRFMQLAGASLFRLSPIALPGLDPSRHVPAAGIAVLTWRHDARRLRITGWAQDRPCGDDIMFDAVESGTDA